MKHFFRRCVVGIGMLGPASAWGQSDTAMRDSTLHISTRWRYGAWVAEGTKQTIKTRLGHRHDRSLYITAVRAERLLHRFGKFQLDYTADLHPLVVATANREYRDQPLCIRGRPCIYPDDAYILVPSRHTAYAFGIVPVGLRVRTKIGGPVQFAIGLGGGGLYFDRRIPDPSETRFNFTADGNLSFLVRTGIGGMSAGFRWHHISNAYMGKYNPALDSHLLFVEYEAR